MPEIKEAARFKVTGRLVDEPELMTSVKGTSYFKFALQVMTEPKNYERKFFAIAFGENAEKLAALGHEGDTLEVTGELQFTKHRDSGRWELQLIAEDGKFLLRAPQNEPGAVGKAQKAADYSDSDF